MLRRALVVAVLGLLAACGSSGGSDAGRDAPGPDGDREAGGDGSGDVAGDANDGDAPAASDANDAPVATDAPTTSDATDAADAFDANRDGPDAAPADGPAAETMAGCGNGQLDPGETCEVPGLACSNCALTSFASCLDLQGPPTWPCKGLAGSAEIACETAVECGLSLKALCASAPSLTCHDLSLSGYSGAPSCYCSDQTCSKGADLTCAAAFRAVAGSTDDAVVLGQLKDSTTTLNHIGAYLAFASCADMCQSDLSLNFNAGKSIVVNEINHIQAGLDPGEFIEIYNGTGSSVDLTGRDLRGYAGGARVLTVPLAGVVPNDGYLVVGNASVPVPAGVKRIDLPQGASVPHQRFVIELLSTGAPDPNPIPSDLDETPFAATSPDATAGSDQTGTACLIPNGVNRYGGFPIHCATPTPGARNIQ
jgi:hypothetical protein